jgi:PqqD family protein of HPr-rel-A system
MTMPSSQPNASGSEDAGTGAVQEWLARARAGAVRPLQRGDVTETDLDDELVLYDPRTGATHALNMTAAVIWEMCDGSLLLDEMARELASTFGLSAEQAGADTAAALAHFQALGLLQSDADQAGGQAQA